MRSLIRGSPIRCGCQNVLTCGDARDALKLFSSRRIDLVICDWMMEPMSGLEFLRELRRPERAFDVPVIMLTASSEAEDVALAQRFKISGWLVKPIALPKMLERISGVLSLSAKDLGPGSDQSQNHSMDDPRPRAAWPVISYRSRAHPPDSGQSR